MTAEEREEPPSQRQRTLGHEEGEGRGEPPSREPAPGIACDLCGAPMLELHCKLLCVRCGYRRDCSDP